MVEDLRGRYGAPAEGVEGAGAMGAADRPGRVIALSRCPAVIALRRAALVSACMVAAFFRLPVGRPFGATPPWVLAGELAALAVSVFSGVGFGDIVPRSQPARLVVTTQMLCDLALLGAAARFVLDAVRGGLHRG